MMGSNLPSPPAPLPSTGEGSSSRTGTVSLSPVEIVEIAKTARRFTIPQGEYLPTLPGGGRAGNTAQGGTRSRSERWPHPNRLENPSWWAGTRLGSLVPPWPWLSPYQKRKVI